MYETLINPPLNDILLITRKILGSIVVSIPACHAGDRGSIPRRGGCQIFFSSYLWEKLQFFQMRLSQPEMGLPGGKFYEKTNGVLLS